MANTYTRDWGSRQPGCLIFLLDQSGSMSDTFGQMQAGRGRRKCDVVATVLNSFLNELVTTNTLFELDGTPNVRPRAEICILGYEGSAVTSALAGALAGKEFVTLSELQINPADIEMRKRKDIDDTGAVIEIEVPFPIWIKPRAGGGTPMCAALHRARDLAVQWAASHSYSYPPVIVNVTDGSSTDGDPSWIAQEITQVSTLDGQALLFNIHITSLPDPPIAYPISENELPNDKYARMLFSISSIIPETSYTSLEAQLGRPVLQGARGLIFNGDAASVRLMFNFASKPATHPLDPNM